MKSAPPTEPKMARVNIGVRVFAVVEFLLVCALVCGVAALHLFVLRGANLCLLFDGFGFLTTTAGCCSVFNWDSLGQVLSYCATGFSESARQSLVSKLEPAQGIVRCGPLLPLLLGAAYTIAAKAPVPQYWLVATWSMWLTQALTVGLMWVSCRLTFNPMVARVAALIGIFYPAFVINSNRLSTETQACFGITLTMTLFLYFAKNKFRVTKQLGAGLFAGLVLGFLALARPPFLLLPVLLISAISLAAWKLKIENPFSKKWLFGAICGAALFLAPWALCNKILTGKASITIDRFAVYNLYTGLNTANLGFDVLPSDLVAHPERFKMPLGEALQAVAGNALKEPVEFATMLALKPVRLLDSPWNDYQNSCLGVPWLAQRYAHEVLLLLSYIGVFALWTRARRSKSLPDFSTALLLTLIVVYNFVHCLFISMARYSYPIMPCVIVLAAFGIASIWKSSKRNGLLVAVLSTPMVSTVIEGMRLPPMAVLPELMMGVGPSAVSGALALLIGFAVAGVFHLGKEFSSGGQRMVYSWVSLAIAMWVAFSSFYGLRQVATPRDAVSTTISVPEKQDTARSSWLLVIDPFFEGFSLDALKSCRLSVNGVALDGDLLPLMARDKSQRESFVYQKAFAHSGQKDLTGIRQWYCVPVPSSLVKPGDNQIEFRNVGEPHSKSVLMCDLIESQKVVSPISLLQFSWTKGFTINPPLDMRMSEKKSDVIEEGSRTRPRIILLAVDALGGEKSKETSPPLVSIHLGEHTIDKKGEKIATLNVPSEKLRMVIDAIKSSTGNTVKLRLRGRCRSLSNVDAKVSCAMITTIKSSTKQQETMAPMAPELIPCSSAGGQFSFVDLIPVEQADGFDCSIRILICGRPWWDVLQYGTYKVDQPVQLSDLALDVSVCDLPDLSGEKYSVFHSSCLTR